jgi:hypothetical protein
MAFIWHNATNLPEYRVNARAIVLNGYLFVVCGGNTASVAENTIYRAQVNGDGTLGAWSYLSGSLPPVARAKHSMAELNGTLMIIGGSGSGDTYSNTVYRTTVTGSSLGTWSATNNVSTQVINNMAVAVPATNQLYTLGGWNGSTEKYSATRRQTLSGGTLNTATATNAMPANNYGGAVFDYGGNIYVVGGSQGDAFTKYVWSSTRQGDLSLGAWSQVSTAPEQVNASGQLIGNTFYSASADKLIKGVITAPNTFSWSTQTLPFTMPDGSCMASSGNFLYLIGGVGHLGVKYTDITQIRKNAGGGFGANLGFNF